MLIGQKQRRGITRVYRLFALVNLARHQMDDAIDYISFAVENAERLEQWYDLAVAGYYAAIIQLLFGNLSWADQLALKAERAARRAGQSEWEDRIRFFQGKLHFETGCYQDALQLFTALKDHPSGTISPEREQLLLAWIYRTTIYLGEPEQSLPFSQDPGPDIPSPAGDALLFQVEASYITGDYQRTIRLTERLPLSSQSRFLYTERPDWRSGFTQCELLQIEPQGLWERMLLTYRGLALCRLSSPEAALEPVFKRVQHFVRNDMLPDRDMHDVFYFYAYYRMLKESEASDMDLNTAVSMAFKRLQHRANHIDDLETRRVFLNLHYWNNALILVAKEHKLT
jgi:tetratricopeptide (TPR) repeat protein